MRIKKILAMAFCFSLISTIFSQNKKIDSTVVRTFIEKVKVLENKIDVLIKQHENKTDHMEPNNGDYFSDGKQFEIVIDFQTRNTFRVPQKIKIGDYYRIRIQDINLNRYKVVINSKDSTLSTAMKTPTFGDISLDALTKLTSGFNEGSPLIKSVLNQESFENYSNNFQLFNQIDAANDTLYKIFTSIDYTSVSNLLQSGVEENLKKQNLENEGLIKGHQDVLKQSKNTLDSLKFEIYEYRLERYISKPDTNVVKYNYATALKRFVDFRSLLQSQQEKVNTAFAEYSKYLMVEEVKVFLKKNESYKANTDKITKAYEEVKSKLDEFLVLVNADNVEKLLKSIIFLHNGSNEYVSFPMQFKGEQEQVDISFVPKDSTSGLQTEKISPFIFPIKSQSYWSIGTSFYYSNLSNERFSTTVTSNMEGIDVFKIEPEDGLNRELGVSVLMRYGRKLKNRTADWFGYHFAFGPGISIEKSSRPRFLGGFGISLGRKHNLVIDYGAILGYVDRKNSGINISTEFSEKPDATITDVQIGSYYAIGYTFSL